MNFYHGKIMGIKKNQIVVFGSNPEGRHGTGMAKLAKERYGAIYGKGRGLQGRSYALVTKNLKAGYLEKSTGITYKKEGFKSISKEQLIENVRELYEFAKNNTDKEFLIAYQNENLNLNGYTSEELLDIFMSMKIPENIRLSITFEDLYNKKISLKSNIDMNI